MKKTAIQITIIDDRKHCHTQVENCDDPFDAANSCLQAAVAIMVDQCDMSTSEACLTVIASLTNKLNQNT